jgi:hypothetical protein
MSKTVKDIIEYIEYYNVYINSFSSYEVYFVSSYDEKGPRIKKITIIEGDDNIYKAFFNSNTNRNTTSTHEIDITEDDFYHIKSFLQKKLNEISEKRIKNSQKEEIQRKTQSKIEISDMLKDPTKKDAKKYNI